MSKLAALLAIAALVTMSILSSTEARPITTHSATSVDKIAHPVVSEKVNEDSCEGLEKEDCLIRRTLEAHLDYIYTGETKP